MLLNAIHCYVARDIAAVLERIRRQAVRADVHVFPLDWTMQRMLVEAGMPFPVAILGETSTTVYEDHGLRRHVVNIGEEGIAQHLSRLDPQESAENIATFLYAYDENDRRHRELMAMALPAVRRWARAIEVLLEPGLTDSGEGVATLLSPWRIASPFRHATRPEVRSQIFTQIPSARWQLFTAPEVLQEPVTTRHDAYAKLLQRIYTRNAYAVHWT